MSRTYINTQAVEQIEMDILREADALADDLRTIMLFVNNSLSDWQGATRQTYDEVSSNWARQIEHMTLKLSDGGKVLGRAKAAHLDTDRRGAMNLGAGMRVGQ